MKTIIFADFALTTDSHFIRAIENEFPHATIIPMGVRDSEQRLMVRTSTFNIPVWSAWHLYLSLHFQDPLLQLDLIRCRNLESLEEKARALSSHIHPTFKMIRSDVLEYAVRLLLAHRLDMIEPHYMDIRNSTSVYYYTTNTKIGVNFEESRLVGTNTVGDMIRKIVAQTGSLAELARVDLPQSLLDYNHRLLGGEIRQYTRPLAIRDSEESPSVARTSAFGRTQAKHDLYLEF